VSSENEKPPVDNFYDAVAEQYHVQYDRDMLYDCSRRYPANYFRLQQLLNSFINKGVKRVIEVGVGEGTPLATLGKVGMDVWGFDISHEMVKKSKLKMQQNNMDPAHVFWGDIQYPETYAHALKNGLFDGAMAMGVMPHVENDGMVLENISALIRPGGSVFIEFRNKLFSLFTFNRHTYDFVLNDLLRDVSEDVKSLVAKELEGKLRMDMPLRREKIAETDKVDYDAILAKFHNPFEIIELFDKNGFVDVKLRWYHYHPAMPHLECEMPDDFRKESIRLEREVSGWRGFFLCSAFVVEAVKA
jgi:2-polyprenyl-3-methyl-5-hydroxy-6-metoxy-1,4-benzoquinol methylase